VPEGKEESTPPVRKIVQVESHNGNLMALYDDGQLWVLKEDSMNKWFRVGLPPIPQEDGK
jgi:hypothetical protein